MTFSHLRRAYFAPMHVGLYLRVLPGVDLVGDVFVDHLEAMPDRWISEIFSSHFLEHLESR